MHQSTNVLRACLNAIVLAIREEREWECTEQSSFIDGALILRGITRGGESQVTFHFQELTPPQNF